MEVPEKGHPADDSRQSDVKIFRISNSRPFTGQRRNSNKPIAPRPPRQANNVPYSREELYDRSKNAEVNLYELREENARLQRAVKELEWKVIQPGSDSSLPINQIRQECKEYQKKIEETDSTLKELKKKIRLSRVNELKRDYKKKIEDGINLRELAEEALRQLSMGFMPDDLESRHEQQTEQLKSLQRNLMDLQLEFEEFKKPGGKRTEDLINRLKASLGEIREENKKVEEENRSIQEEINYRKQNTPCPQCGNVMVYDNTVRQVEQIFGELLQGLKQQQIDLQEFFQQMNPYNMVSIEDFYQLIMHLQLDFTEIEVNRAWAELSPNRQIAIPLAQFCQILESIDNSMSPAEFEQEQ